MLVLVLVLYGCGGDSSVKNNSQQKIAEHQMAIALVPSKKDEKTPQIEDVRRNPQVTGVRLAQPVFDMDLTG
mgnify:CR=1 FL=1